MYNTGIKEYLYQSRVEYLDIVNLPILFRTDLSTFHMRIAGVERNKDKEIFISS